MRTLPRFGKESHHEHRESCRFWVNVVPPGDGHPHHPTRVAKLIFSLHAWQSYLSFYLILTFWTYFFILWNTHLPVVFYFLPFSLFVFPFSRRRRALLFSISENLQPYNLFCVKRSAHLVATSCFISFKGKKPSKQEFKSFFHLILFLR
jgi:hypothetical protein